MYRRKSLLERLHQTFNSPTVSEALNSAALHSRLTDDQFLLLVPTASMHGVIDELWEVLHRIPVDKSKLVTRYLRLMGKRAQVPAVAAISDTSIAADPLFVAKPRNRSPLTIEMLERFLDEYPEMSHSFRSIADGMSVVMHHEVSASTVRRRAKQAAGDIQKKTLHIAPKHLGAQEVDSTLSYLDALSDFMDRAAKTLEPSIETAPDVLKEAMRSWSDDKWAFARCTAFADQTPIVQGASVNKIWAHQTHSPHSGGTLQGNLMGQTYILSAVITLNRVVKTWLHVNDKGSAVKVGSDEIVRFYTEELAPRNKDHSGVGGPAVGPLLKSLGIKFLIFDSVGRSGATATPVSSHFSPTIFAHLVKFGIRPILLPPAGCMGNPIELWNGNVQKWMRAYLPADAQRHRLPGVTNIDEAESALHAFVIRSNKGETSHHHNYDYYNKRAFGDELWRGVKELPVQWCVRELRRQRYAHDQVIQVRPIFTTEERIEFVRWGTDHKQKHSFQSIGASVAKRAAKEQRRAVRAASSGAGAGADPLHASFGQMSTESFRLRPYLGWDRYRVCLYALNILVGTYGSYQIKRVRDELANIQDPQLQELPVYLELSRRIEYLYKLAPPVHGDHGPSSLRLPHVFTCYVLGRDTPYQHTVADLRAKVSARGFKWRAPAPRLTPEKFDDPFGWAAEDIRRIVYEVRKLFPDQAQPDLYFQFGEVLDIAWGAPAKKAVASGTRQSRGKRTDKQPAGGAKQRRKSEGLRPKATSSG